MSQVNTFIEQLEACRRAAEEIDAIMDQTNKPLMVLNSFDAVAMATTARTLGLNGDARPAAMRQDGDRIVELRKAIRDVVEIAETIRTNMDHAVQVVG